MLCLAAILFVASIYTKQTALFIFVGTALGLAVWCGPRLLLRPHVWGVAVGFMLALVPLALMQLRLGAFNVISALHRSDMNSPSRFSLAGIDWYALHIP